MAALELIRIARGYPRASYSIQDMSPGSRTAIVNARRNGPLCFFPALLHATTKCLPGGIVAVDHGLPVVGKLAPPI